MILLERNLLNLAKVGAGASGKGLGRLLMEALASFTVGKTTYTCQQSGDYG